MSDVWGEWRWTLRGRGGEKRREKVENENTCFIDSIDFAIRSWDEDSCVCNCHKGWPTDVTLCRYIACCLKLAMMKKTTSLDEKKQRCDEGDEQKRMRWQCWAYLWARLVSVCCSNFILSTEAWGIAMLVAPCIQNMSSECGERDGGYSKERKRKKSWKRRRERVMWERREDDHTFHTCSADLISVSYTYEPTFSIFFLILTALFTSSCASITAFSFCVEGKQRRGGGEKDGGGHTLISQSLCKLSQESFLSGCQGLLAPGEVPLHLLLCFSKILVIHFPTLNNGQQLLLKLVDALHHSLEVFSLLHCVQSTIWKLKYFRMIFWRCQIQNIIIISVGVRWGEVNGVKRCSLMDVEDVLFDWEA